MINRKHLLAAVRQGEYIHPGEAEAIDIAMQPLLKNPPSSLLDVGCGLGGSAYYMQQLGFTRTCGIDISEDVIRHAKQKYPSVRFEQLDVLQAKEYFGAEKFAAFSLFCSFFSFLDQQQSLTALGKIAEPGAELVLFDYFARKNYANENPLEADSSKPFTPISAATIEPMLQQAGWHLIKLQDISHMYEIWYEEVIAKLSNKRESLIADFGIDAFNYIYTGFNNLLNYNKAEKIGGAIVYATRHLSA